MDFRLAKREVGEITMTVDGQLLGTPAHMSPEQASGRSYRTDRRTDIYSLGVVMYRQFVSAVARLESQELPRWEIAVGCIALGVLAYASSRAEEAADQFDLAEKLLRPLVMQSPNDSDLITVLAACRENLALLDFSRNPSESIESLQEAG